MSTHPASPASAPLLNRAERRKQHTHDAIKLAVSALLVERGYAALSIQSITERADIGYGTFYLHFEDKDDAIWAVLVEASERIRAETDAKLAHEPYPRREYLGWIAFFENIDVLRDSLLDLLGSRGSAKLQHKYHTYLAHVYETNLEQAKYSAGIDIPPAFLAQFIAGAIVRLLIWWLETPVALTPRDMAQLMYRTAFRQDPPD
jgi:AcrR family transcriptional regulator